MPDSPIWGFIIIVIFLIFGAFLGASETAYTTASRIKLKVKAENGSRTAVLALKIVERVEPAVISILILNNLINVAMSSLATLIFIKLGYVDQASFLSTLVITFAVFLIADSIPKSIAQANPELFAMLCAYPMVLLMILVFPAMIIFQGFNKVLGKIFRLKNNQDMVTEEDLANIIEASEEAGKLDEEETELIQSALELDTLFVKDVLTPRNKIFAVNITGLTHEKLQATIMASNYSRIPVYKDDLDHIVGVIVVRAYLKKYFENQTVGIKKTLTKPYFVSPNILLDDLLEGFKKNSTHIAFVIDKKKQLLGMVTMEDVLEELVGQTDQKTSKALGRVRE
ncbi:MAG: hemolysin family protein [Bacilli bacterium]|jgi:putative hemolysin